jgi:hypothetical protein
VFKAVSVWLDALAPERGAFAHASEWAARLGVPLHGVIGPAPPRTADTASVKTIAACDAACVRRGISWDTEHLAESTRQATGFFKETELAAFSAALPSTEREQLLSESESQEGSAVMVCSTACNAHARALILQQGSEIAFLERVVPFCRVLAAPPIVLTHARSERLASERQELAREIFYRHALDAEFDLIAGCELQTAVGWVTHARGCSSVIVERECLPSWRRWFRGDTARRLLALADRLTIIALPGSSILEKQTGLAGERN